MSAAERDSSLLRCRSASNPFHAGQRFQYSGEGYWYLQSIITHLAGTVDPAECGAYEAGMRQCATDIDTYLRTNVLTPCRMRSGGSRQIATLGLKQTLLTRPYGIDIVLAS